MIKRLLWTAFLVTATVSLIAQGGIPGGGPEQGLNTRPPNAPQQTPAVAGQTRAPEQKLNVPFSVVTVTEGLVNPWSLAFLPSGRMLVTERPGRMRVLSADGKTMTLNCEGPDMVNDGQTALYRDVIELIDDNHRTLTSFGQQENGEWQQFMKSRYTRV